MNWSSAAAVDCPALNSTVSVPSPLSTGEPICSIVAVQLSRSVEYGADIIEASYLNKPKVIYGSVLNQGLIENLPSDGVVEVKTLVDGSGYNPCRFGTLPPQLAALCRTNMGVYDCIVDGLLNEDREQVVRGMMLNFSGSRHGADQRIGALIKPQSFPSGREIPGTDVSVGLMMADGTTGSFQARVYYRPYRNATGTQVGGAYAILSAGQMDAAGSAGSIWIYLTPLLVLLGCGLIILQANQAGQGARALARDLDSIGRGRLDTRVAQTAGGEVGLAQKQAERNPGVSESSWPGSSISARSSGLPLAHTTSPDLASRQPRRASGL